MDTKALYKLPKDLLVKLITTIQSDKEYIKNLYINILKEESNLTEEEWDFFVEPITKEYLSKNIVKRVESFVFLTKNRFKDIVWKEGKVFIGICKNGKKPVNIVQKLKGIWPDIRATDLTIMCVKNMWELYRLKYEQTINDTYHYNRFLEGMYNKEILEENIFLTFKSNIDITN